MSSMMWVLSLMVLVVNWPGDVQSGMIPKFLERGRCARISLTEDFDPNRYSGLWFDIESVPNEYQHTKKCVSQNYTWTGDYMNVVTKGLSSEDKKIRQIAIMKVEQSVPSPNPAHMTVEAMGVPKAPYQVVSTDYRSYSCVYSCLAYFGFRAEFFWVFSRKPTLPAEKIRICHRTFSSFGIDYQKMIPIIQGEPCPYYGKLPEMLHESDQQLLKVLGPYVPTSSAPTTVPPIISTIGSQSLEEELKNIKEIVQEERNIIQEMEEEIVHNAELFAEETAKASERTPENTGVESSASLSAVSVILLILPLFMTAAPLQ